MQKTNHTPESRTWHRLRAVLARIPAPALVIATFLLTLSVVFLTNGDMLAKGLSTAFLPTATEEPLVEVKAPAPDSQATAGIPDLKRLQPLPPEQIDTETLWLARCIYSETKKPEEQELVAWVVRNRVETNYRGEDSYEEVVLDPMQFSAFNGGRTRRFYTGLTPHSKTPGWQKALSIAHAVKVAPPEARPFPIDTRHFYSLRSMDGKRHPNWAAGKASVDPKRDYDIDENRFRFIEGVY
ncbi:MAG TPA: hypothetical protein VFG50_08365 [Rhodothermales bacterium]|nr:hypothetical protein [Rhodothermales bacterium]